MTRLLDVLKVGMMLCDVPTPALILDHSTVTSHCKLDDAGLDAALNSAPRKLADMIYAHASVLSGRDPNAGAVGSTTIEGATYTEPVKLAQLDCTTEHVGGSTSLAWVGLGLNNHLTGGYYWGRASGPGAAMPAPGVSLSADADDSSLQLLRVDNSNDGKRSEWCEFLRAGDQVQIVPASHTKLLASGPFDVLVGVRRVGDGVAPGAEPVVDAAWQREESSGQWSRVL